MYILSQRTFLKIQDRKETDKLNSLFFCVESTLCRKQMNGLNSQIALELIHRLISFPCISLLLGHVYLWSSKNTVSVTRWQAGLLRKHHIECITMAQELLIDDYSNIYFPYSESKILSSLKPNYLLSSMLTSNFKQIETKICVSYFSVDKHQVPPHSLKCIICKWILNHHRISSLQRKVWEQIFPSLVRVEESLP